MRGTNTSGEGFHSAIQNSVTNMHPSIWKLIPLLTKEQILAKKKKRNAERGDKSTSQKIVYKNTINRTLGRQGTTHKIKSVICAVSP